MFGGVGKRLSEHGASCAIDDAPTESVRYEVGSKNAWATNLCDLWRFVPYKGWQLVRACPRDRPHLLRGGLIATATATGTPAAAAATSERAFYRDGPDPPAGILASTWVVLGSAGQPHGGGGAGSSSAAAAAAVAAALWMYGGVDACGPTLGVCADGSLVRQPGSSNATSCATQRGDGVASSLPSDGAADDPCHLFTANYIDSNTWVDSPTLGTPGYTCGGSLWRFDTVTHTWTLHHQPPTGGQWPQPKCGGHAVSFPESSQSTAATVIVGGWTGNPIGECNDEATCAPASSGWHWGAS